VPSWCPTDTRINPNPAWANDGKLAFMAGFAGIEYRDMLRLILEAAIARVRAGR
jgi:D-alanine-D-alanine ligase